MARSVSTFAAAALVSILTASLAASAQGRAQPHRFTRDLQQNDSGNTCSALVTEATSWGDGPYTNEISLQLASAGGATYTAPYTLTLEGPYSSIDQAWNWNPTLGAVQGSIVGTVSESWENLVPNGSWPNIGGIIESPSNGSVAPTAVLINGNPCTITYN